MRNIRRSQDRQKVSTPPLLGSRLARNLHYEIGSELSPQERDMNAPIRKMLTRPIRRGLHREDGHFQMSTESMSCNQCRPVKLWRPHRPIVGTIPGSAPGFSVEDVTGTNFLAIELANAIRDDLETIKVFTSDLALIVRVGDRQYRVDLTEIVHQVVDIHDEVTA